MKKFIKQIRRLRMLIAILLKCCFVFCKNLILLDMHKISKVEAEWNICCTLQVSIFKAYWNDLIDDNEFYDLTDKLLK